MSIGQVNNQNTVGFKAPVEIQAGSTAATAWIAPVAGVVTLYINPTNTNVATERYSRNDIVTSQGLCPIATSGLITQSSIPIAKGDVLLKIYTSNIQSSTLTFNEFKML